MAKVAVFFTNGFEEVEALTVVDLLRRAKVETLMVSVTGEEWVTGSHDVTVKMDGKFEEVEWEGLDMLILPGGPGVGNLLKHEGLIGKLKEFDAAGKTLAAICAAPRVLGLNGMLEGKEATCYPGLEGDLLGAKWKEESVVHSENVITSRGLGTSIDFASAILAHLKGKDQAEEIEKAVVYRIK